MLAYLPVCYVDGRWFSQLFDVVCDRCYCHQLFVNHMMLLEDVICHVVVIWLMILPLWQMESAYRNLYIESPLTPTSIFSGTVTMPYQTNTVSSSHYYTGPQKSVPTKIYLKKNKQIYRGLCQSANILHRPSTG